MTQFARPNADVADGVFTNELGGTTLFSSIDETVPSAADYAVSTAWVGSFDELTVGLSAVTRPSVRTGHTLRVQWSVPVFDGTDGALGVDLFQGTTFIAGITDAFTGVDNGTVVLTLSEAQVANITNYGNLRCAVRFSDDGGDASNAEGRVEWVALEVPDPPPLKRPQLPYDDEEDGRFSELDVRNWM